MASVKHRIIAAIGDGTIERPRELQRASGTDEHSVVHVLYALQKDGLVSFKKKKSVHSPGINLTRIKLTDAGRKALGKE